MRLASLELQSLLGQGYFLRYHFLPPDDCASMLDRMEARRHLLAPARVGVARSRSTAVRTDEIAWLTASEEPHLLDRFEDLKESLQNSLRTIVSRFDVQFAKYAPGGDFSGYARHVDAVASSQKYPRRLTAVLYLNSCRGGQLRLYVKEGPVDVAPEPGLLCVFMSQLVEHEVLQVESNRFAVTAWYY
jgi:hypothetical protein